MIHEIDNNFIYRVVNTLSRAIEEKPPFNFSYGVACFYLTRSLSGINFDDKQSLLDHFEIPHQLFGLPSHENGWDQSFNAYGEARKHFERKSVKKAIEQIQRAMES